MSNEAIITVIVASLGSAGLWSLINNIYLSNRKENETIELLKKAELVILQDRLLYLCTKYVEDEAENGIEANKLKSLHNLYEVYQTLGGNGFVSDLMKRVNTLKVR